METTKREHRRRGRPSGLRLSFFAQIPILKRRASCPIESTRHKSSAANRKQRMQSDPRSLRRSCFEIPVGTRKHLKASTALSLTLYRSPWSGQQKQAISSLVVRRLPGPFSARQIRVGIVQTRRYGECLLPGLPLPSSQGRGFCSHRAAFAEFHRALTCRTQARRRSRAPVR